MASGKRASTRREAQQGFVLVTVLWFLAIFFMVAMIIAYLQRLEVKVTLYQQEKLQAYYLARQNVIQAVHMLSEYWANQDPQSAPGDGSWDLWERDLGSGRYSIQNEGGKLNLNYTNPAVLGRVLSALGLERPQASMLRDSILDWIDRDSMSRSSGAEKDYYSGLASGLTPRNSHIRGLGELFAVRGMNPAMALGLGDEAAKLGLEPGRGLFSACTVYGRSRRVDFNSAPVEVLSALPGMDPGRADRVARIRRTSPFYDNESVKDAIGEKAFRSVAPFVTTTPSRYYTILSEAWTLDEGARHSIMAVVYIGRRGDSRFVYWVDDVYYRWPEGGELKW